MTQITTLDNLLQILTGASGTLFPSTSAASGCVSGTVPINLFQFKDPNTLTSSAATPVAGRLISSYFYNGSPAGSTGFTAGDNTADNTTSGMKFPTTFNTKSSEYWMLSAGFASLAAGTFLIYDRIAYNGALAIGTTAGPQSCSISPNHNARYTQSFWTPTQLSSSFAGIGNFIGIEIWAAIGATAVSVNVDYINEKGTKSTTPTASIGGVGLQEAQRFIMLPLAPGDIGVCSVNTINLSATTGTAGVMAVVIGHPLAWVPVSTYGSVRDMIIDMPSLTDIRNTANIQFLFLPNTTTTLQFMANIKFVEAY